MGPTQPIAGRPPWAVRFTVLGTLVPVAIATATGWASHRTVFFIGALLAALGAIAGRLLPRVRLLLLAATATGLTLMQARAGGIASGYSALLIAATIGVGLEADDAELVAATAILAACCFVPMLLIGSPAYPVNWGNAALVFSVGAAVIGTLRALRRESEVLTRRLTQEAMLDDLTGVLNRRGWRHTAPRELARAARTGAPTALLTLDLDDLKFTNDNLGHREGDRLLHDTAARMREMLRAGDVIARLGGDEFAALLTDSTLHGTLTAVERLRAATPPEASFSVGVAIWDRNEGLQDLILRSDQALYAAKAAGGGRTEVAETGLEDLAARLPEGPGHRLSMGRVAADADDRSA